MKRKRKGSNLRAQCNVSNASTYWYSPYILNILAKHILCYKYIHIDQHQRQKEKNKQVWEDVQNQNKIKNVRNEKEVFDISFTAVSSPLRTFIAWLV